MFKAPPKKSWGCFRIAAAPVAVAALLLTWLVIS